MNRYHVLLLLAGLGLASSGAQGQTLWSQDFQNPLFFTQPNTSYSFVERMNTPLDANRWFWGYSGSSGIGQAPAMTNPATITITNLPAHTRLELTFDLYIIRTWDGPTNNLPLGIGPSESFRVQADGTTLLHTTFSHYGVQNYPDPIGGATHPFGTGALEADTLGFLHPVNPGTQGIVDWVYRITISNFAHTASSITLTFEGLDLEPHFNESFGLDNMRLVAPSPGAGVLFAGAALVGLRRRRR